MKIIWSERSVNDIERLKYFIAQENLSASIRAADSIKEAAKILTKIPSIGKPVNGLNGLNLYRDLFTRFGGGGYVLRYYVHEENIYIVHVRHYRENNFT